VVDSRSRLQTQLTALKTQRDQWESQGQQQQEQLAEAEVNLEELAARRCVSTLPTPNRTACWRARTRSTI
jgi:hypothetical protein